MDIENYYNLLVCPQNFVKTFKDNEEFKDWARIGSIKDLFCALEEFKHAELYEYCRLISDVIKEKKLNDQARNN